jgi:hypothetical protein
MKRRPLEIITAAILCLCQSAASPSSDVLFKSAPPVFWSRLGPVSELWIDSVIFCFCHARTSLKKSVLTMTWMGGLVKMGLL